MGGAPAGGPGPGAWWSHDDEREFVERTGLFFEAAGGSRTAGRILGWLMICDPPHQSITELAAALGMGKASISMVTRQMQQSQYVERVPVRGSSQHHYQLKEGGWTQIIQGRLAFFRAGLEVAEYGFRAVGDAPRQRLERLEEYRDLLTFMEKEGGEELIRRWESYRDERRDERRARSR